MTQRWIERKKEGRERGTERKVRERRSGNGIERDGEREGEGGWWDKRGRERGDVASSSFLPFIFFLLKKERKREIRVK
jgi:hypothetical protein